MYNKSTTTRDDERYKNVQHIKFKINYFYVRCQTAWSTKLKFDKVYCFGNAQIGFYDFKVSTELHIWSQYI